MGHYSYENISTMDFVLMQYALIRSLKPLQSSEDYSPYDNYHI